MRKLIIIWFAILILIVLFALYVRRYSNPYKLYMVFGKKGSGKSTLIARLAYKYVRQGRNVYVNIPLSLPPVRPNRRGRVGSLRSYNVDDIGRFTFPPRSVVFIDEVGMIWDNRQFKNFRTDVRDWFKLQRHYQVTVWLFSQTFDIDVKLRNLTDQMFMVSNHFNVLSIARRINRKLVIVEPTGESEGRITDGYEIQPLFLQLFGLRSVYVTWIPRFSKFFDTRDLSGHVLPDIGYESLSEYVAMEEADSRISGAALSRHSRRGAFPRRVPRARLARVPLTCARLVVAVKDLFQRHRKLDDTISAMPLDSVGYDDWEDMDV